MPAKTAPDSPLSALYRLYGPAAPLCALGLEPGHLPDKVVAATLPHTSGSPELTAGEVMAAGASCPFALSWWLEAGKPVIGEVLPGLHPLVAGATNVHSEETVARLHERAPSPVCDLDPVASLLWRVETAQAGLPMAVRSLATWWRVQGAAGASQPPPAIAAAVAGAVARATGMRRPRAQLVTDYGADREGVDRVARELRRHLQLDRIRGW